MQNVVFKFRRPNGAEQQQPSRALTEALHRLGEAEEMQPLLAQARRVATPSPSRSFRLVMVNHYSFTSRRRQHEELRQFREAGERD